MPFRAPGGSSDEETDTILNAMERSLQCLWHIWQLVLRGLEQGWQCLQQATLFELPGDVGLSFPWWLPINSYVAQTSLKETH